MDTSETISTHTYVPSESASYATHINLSSIDSVLCGEFNDMSYVANKQVLLTGHIVKLWVHEVRPIGPTHPSIQV